MDIFSYFEIWIKKDNLNEIYYKLFILTNSLYNIVNG